MSLHVLANHMATHGRGPDSMLVHMSPQEVQSLQELAMKNGGTLTINPQTGLPEAGFLDSILPIVAGIALGPAGFGLMSAGMAGLTVGGVTALASGSLEKGLMAGFGAYGGAGLGEALMGSAAGATTAELAAKSAVEDQSMAEASRLAGKEIAAQTPFQQISTGVQGLGTEAGRTGALDAVGGGMNALKYGAAAIAPIMADQMVQTTTKAPSTDTGYIRQKIYDPISGTYSEVGPVKASDWGSRSFSDLRRGYADGGIVALASGDLIEDSPAAAPATPRFTPEQVASYIQNNKLDAAGQAAAQKSFGVSDDIFNQGLALLQPGASQAGVQAATNAYYQSATPQQDAANRAFAQQQGLTTAAAPVAAPAPPRPITPDQTSPLIAPATPAPVQGTATTATTGGLDSLAANQAATTGAGTTGSTGVLNLLADKGAQTVVGNTTGEGTFQKVYDPKTGREFNSPMQAAQYGVTDYVTSLPATTTLPATTQNAVNTWLAKPENKGKTASDALNALGSQFGMTGEQLRNAEIQGSIGYGDQQAVRNAVSTASGNLTPDQLVAKLQAYKTNPPATAQEFADQQALYADYANRYANSSYNYANMGGKSQDFSLKPKDYLGVTPTGYADPINQLLSSMPQNTPTFQKVVSQLTTNPEISNVIKQIYSANPNAFKGGSVEPLINNLASDIDKYGTDTAVRNFVSQQQNLLSMLPDAKGDLGNFNQSTMSNPAFVAMQQIKDSYTPVISDDKWNKQSSLGVPKDSTFSDAYRDPNTGKGLSLVYDKSGAVQGVRFIDQSGIGNIVYNDPAKLVEAAYQSGIPLSAFNELSKKLGTDVIKKPDGSSYYPKGLENGLKLSDIANGNLAKAVASNDYLNFMIKDSVDKTPDAFLDQKLQTVKNQSKIAQDYLATLSGTPVAGNAASTTGATTGTTGGLDALAANMGTTGIAGATAGSAVTDDYVNKIKAAVAANPNANAAQIKAAMTATGLNPADVALAMQKAGLSSAAAYAATSPDFKGATSGTGLLGLNANIKNAMAQAATLKPDATAAEIKSILAGYGADSSDFVRAMGMTPEQWDAAHSSTKTPISTDTKITTGTNPTQRTTTTVDTPTNLNVADKTALPVGVSGNQTSTINPNGTVSMNTGTPNMPVGGYTGMQSLRDAYTKGGGSLGYTPYTPKTMAEFNAKYTNTGDTKSAYDYLMGKGAYPTKSNVGQIMRPYNEATLGMPAAGNRPTIWDQASGRYIKNPDYVRPMRDSSGNVTYGMSQKELTAFLTDQAKNPTMSGQELYDWAVKNNVSAQDIADARGVPLSEVYAQFRNFKQAADAKKAADATADTTTTTTVGNNKLARGGVTHPFFSKATGKYNFHPAQMYADGGYAVGGGLGSLGGYSDGGQLLRGPGDGVSDSIPASIGQTQQPARLADGEFVVPARIVSELGNGSTEAGARKLYAMMDRVQRARGKTTGKDRVAANTSADKYLPA